MTYRNITDAIVDLITKDHYPLKIHDLACYYRSTDRSRIARQLAQLIITKQVPHKDPTRPYTTLYKECQQRISTAIRTNPILNGSLLSKESYLQLLPLYVILSVDGDPVVRGRVINEIKAFG